MTSKAPINVGIVGYGSSARIFHLPFILNVPDLRLYAFMQRAPAPLAGTEPAKPHCTIDYPDVKHYTNLDEFLSDEEVELVVVLTQQDSHAEIAEKAIKAGKHGEPLSVSWSFQGDNASADAVVVVEKPITETLEQADRLVRARNESGKILAPFQSMCVRSGPAMVALMDRPQIRFRLSDRPIAHLGRRFRRAAGIRDSLRPRPPSLGHWHRAC